MALQAPSLLLSEDCGVCLVLPHCFMHDFGGAIIALLVTALCFWGTQMSTVQ